MKFTLQHTDPHSKARAGEVQTAHGNILTPIFMPVGTAGTVKAVHIHELHEPVRAQIILGNTYHLYLRPGTDVLQGVGGLHKFMGWDKPILTDSGGYQVYSLADMRKITEEGAEFRSHLDGSKHFFTPEGIMDIQRKIGGDIIMAFDECPPYPCEYDYAKKSMHLTHRWLKRCINHFNSTEPLYGYEQTLMPIVQGSVYKDLRIDSAKFIADCDMKANAIGGLSVGEPKPDLYEMAEVVCDILPKEKPRYLMGVGTPGDLLECISLGVDMFDCVIPTRNGRNGMIYTKQGIINITNEKWKDDYTPIDEISESPLSRFHSKAYLRHLMKCNEYLGKQIASINNLSMFLWLVGQARENIINGTFAQWKKPMIEQVMRRL